MKFVCIELFIHMYMFLILKPKWIKLSDIWKTFKKENNIKTMKNL